MPRRFRLKYLHTAPARNKATGKIHKVSVSDPKNPSSQKPYISAVQPSERQPAGLSYRHDHFRANASAYRKGQNTPVEPRVTLPVCILYISPRHPPTSEQDLRVD